MRTISLSLAISGSVDEIARIKNFANSDLAPWVESRAGVPTSEVRVSRPDAQGITDWKMMIFS